MSNNGENKLPELASQSVLVESEELPEDTPTVKGLGQYR